MDNLPRDSLNSVSPLLTEKSVSALTKHSHSQAQTQDRLDTLPKEIDKKIKAQQSIFHQKEQRFLDQQFLLRFGQNTY